MRLAHALLVLATSLSFFACAPSNAAAIRKDRSLTLGLPGASYRPSGQIAVGATGGYTSEQKTTVDNNKTGFASVVSNKDENPDSQRELVMSSYSINPFLQYFLWDTSAFFIGAAASFNRANYQFDEQTVDSTSLNPQYGEVNYETKSTYVGVPIGWAWIWTPGFSLTLDFGPRARISRSTTVTQDGSSKNVSSNERDKTIDTIDSLEPRYTLGGSGIIGWSF